MTRKLSKMLPVGINPKPVIALSVIGIICCVLFSGLCFLVEFFDFYAEIFYFDDAGNRCFYDFPKMEPLTSFNATFDVFRIFFLCMVMLGGYFFLYHFMGSKSIYTMRRLGNPAELHIRCLALPVIFTVFGIALIYFMNFIFIELYLALVPEKSLQPMWNANIWRDLL